VLLYKNLGKTLFSDFVHNGMIGSVMGITGSNVNDIIGVVANYIADA